MEYYDLKEMLCRMNELKECAHSGEWPSFRMDGNNYRERNGICTNVAVSFDDRVWLRDKFEELGYTSIFYPVEGMFVGDHYKCIELFADTASNRYNSSTPIGKARLSLLDKLIELAEKELKELCMDI